MIAVIPARWASSRFPGKPLVPLLGKPMVQHVWDRCREAGCFEAVVVATDDARIAEAVRSFGGEVAMTSAACASGTDRVAEVARARGGEVFVNVQGDEPALAPEALKALAAAFDDATTQLATLVRPLEDSERTNSNVVKVVRDEAGRALYFSRADLPAGPGPARRWAHVGIYGYRTATLLRLASLRPTELELAERLEQLRALGHGIAIQCVETTQRSHAVDVPGDVAAVERALRAVC